MADAQEAERVFGENELEKSDWLKHFKKEVGSRDKTIEHQAAIDRGLRSLAEVALDFEELVSDDVDESIDSIIHGLDKQLEDHINRILHNEKFQELEGTWRGLFHLVNHTDQEEMLQIKVLNISKPELARTLSSFQGARWDQSPLFKKIYRDEFSLYGGTPYACLIGDFYFDSSGPDVATLGGMAKIASAAHCPFIAAASPGLLNMETWQELPGEDQLADLLQGPAYAKWRSLRDPDIHPDSNYIGLTLPRVLARLPYDRDENVENRFVFHEDCDGTDHKSYTWSNAAYAMGVNINRAFKDWGWCTMIRGVEGGGIVTDLPVHNFPSPDGSIDMKCPTEVAIDDRRQRELAELGFIPLLHKKDTDVAAFFEAPSLQKPKCHGDKTGAQETATASAKLAADLPCIFPTSRFAHYLKVFCREKVGRNMECEDVRKMLQDWIDQYVESKVDATEEMKRKRPLAAARVDVLSRDSGAGEYEAQFFLRPHYQLKDIDIALTLVSKLPTQPGT